MKKRGNETFARALNAQKLFNSVIACGVVMQARSIAQKLATVFQAEYEGIPVLARPTRIDDILNVLPPRSKRSPRPR
jgi:hypothetical protein